MVEEVRLSRTSSETKGQVERAENVQVLVAIAVLSGYLSNFTSYNAPFQSFSFVIRLLALGAFLFLVGKLLTLTVRPFYEHAWLRKIDRKVLPVLFTLVFAITAAVIIPSIILPTDIEVGKTIQEFFQLTLGPLKTVDIYICVCAIASLAFGHQYALWIAKTMSELETTAPDVPISFTSGSQGETFPLELRNPYNNEIPPEDIRIEIESTSGVDVKINQAKSLGEGIWRPRLAVPSNSRMNIKIQITRSEEAEQISDESVKITTKYLNRTKNTNIVELSG